MKKTDARFVVPVTDIAAIFGVADRTIQRLVKEGLPQIGHGKYDVRQCVQWQFGQLRSEAATREGLNPRDELAIAQKERVGLEIAQLRGTLIPRDLVSRAMNQVAALVSSQLDGLAPRLAGELADMTDPQQIQATLLREARTTRTAIAQAMRELGQHVETGEAFDDEDADVDAA